MGRKRPESLSPLDQSFRLTIPAAYIQVRKCDCGCTAKIAIARVLRKTALAAPILGTVVDL